MFDAITGLGKLALNTVDLATKPIEPLVNAANEVIEEALEDANAVIDDLKS